MTASSTRLAAVTALSLIAACSGSSATSGAPASPAPKAAPAATAAAATPAAAPRPFEYAASTGQYRFVTSAKVTQSMMGQSQDMTTSNNRLMTIALARTTSDTMTMNLTIDSITVVGAMGMTPPGVDKVPGAKFSAKISPNGAFYSATGPTMAENPLAAGMTDELGRAMPRIRAILTMGKTWTDTLKDHVTQNGIAVDREIITTYSVVGDSTVGGESSWKLSREMVTKGTGKGNVQGQDITLESSGKGKGILLVSKKGVLMGGQGEETSLGSVVLAANGMQIGLNSTTTSTFTKVK